jgi:phosphate transport system permease protein
VKRRIWANRIAGAATIGCAIVTAGILLSLLGYIAIKGFSALSLEFLTSAPRPAGEGGGIGNAIIGSLFMITTAALMSIPVAILLGIFLSEFGNSRLASIVRFITDSLAGVPSIVIGIFVFTVIVAPLGRPSGFAGAAALAIIMLPIIARTTEEAIRLVPVSVREGALALGAPQWRVTLGVILPGAASGITTGAMLAIARVAGETAPLLFTAVGSRFFNLSLDQPMSSLTVQIYTYATGPFDVEHRMAWAATLVLMTIVLAINVTVRTLSKRTMR